LKQFATDGLVEGEIMRLKELIATFLNKFLDYLFVRCQHIPNRQKCPSEWVELVLALTSKSPVCALIYPGDELRKVLTKIAEGNSTIDMYTLQILQRECPILFDILRSKKSLPSQLHPVLYELLKRSNAPFDVPKNKANVVDYPCSDDSYFPNLPVVRSRGLYVADTARKAKICTKRGSSHPTLLPGIFTLFCSHGMVQYNTVIYTTSI
jgi:hypothetical protein